MGILDLIGKKIVFLDGATGTYLQSKGLKAGEFPEYFNINSPEIVIEMHKEFLNAGSDIILANTFGANKFKFDDVEKIINAGVANAKVAIDEHGKDAYIGLDVGPLGKLLKPMGDLSFDEAYSAFKQIMICGEKSGADLVYIETMTDTYELKAAVLAAKENTSLPIFATVTFDQNAKLLTGGDVASVVAMLEGLGVDALGVNCGLGPKQMINVIKEVLKFSSVPVIAKPNAGLPRQEGDKTVFDVTEDDFAFSLKEFAEIGVNLIGGCCGTKASHIAKMVEVCKNIQPKPIEFKNDTIISSYSKAVFLGNDPKIIGERINPTGKSKFKQALRDNNIEYIIKEGITQADKGAHILDVNVGLPEIDEEKMMVRVIEELQSVIDLPLQIDTVDFDAMESAMRIYNGKPMINSVSGKQEVMDKVFTLVKKYGGVVVGLTLDESGIPDNAEDRFAIAQKIIDTAKTYGIDKKDIVIDVLAMTISSDKMGAVTTLKALELVRNKLGVNTILGVSNISFGLPQRENINTAFYTMAMQKGLTTAIINPSSVAMMQAFHSVRALNGLDENFIDYISSATNVNTSVAVAKELTLAECVEKGLKSAAHEVTLQLLENEKPLDIIKCELIPALDLVGQKFEKGELFLPQLLMSAEAAKSAFGIINNAIEKSGTKQEKKGKIILATVKGDIHDIGKNIVKVLLENYGFDVIDLGKDVEVSLIVDTVLEHGIKLVGLSALMTTTVVSMEETIKALRKHSPETVVMVGGAVLTQAYADMIGADKYCVDAMASVHFANEVFDA